MSFYETKNSLWSVTNRVGIGLLLSETKKKAKGVNKKTKKIKKIFS